MIDAEDMDAAAEAVVIAIILTALALGVLLLRCVSRFVILKHFGPEDSFIILAFVLSSSFTAIVVLCEHPQKKTDYLH